MNKKFEYTITELKLEESKWGFLILPILIICLPLFLKMIMLSFVFLLVMIIIAKIFNIKNLFKEDCEEVFDLVNNEFVQIQLHKEYDEISKTWYNTTYEEHEFIYQIKTIPVIKKMEGSIISTFYKEFENGIFLQKILFKNEKVEISSELVWIDYYDLNIKDRQEIGPYFIYDAGEKIKGFNRTKQIEIEIQES